MGIGACIVFFLIMMFCLEVGFDTIFLLFWPLILLFVIFIVMVLYLYNKYK